MKKILLILFMLLLFTSCFNKKEQIKELEQVKEEKEIIVEWLEINKTILENIWPVILHRNLYNITTKIEFKDEKDVEKFRNDLQILNEVVDTQTWSITLVQILNKVKFLWYLWESWKALEIYENNYNTFSWSIAYNHNMWRLYDKLWEYQSSLNMYWYIIEKFKQNRYLIDISKVFKKMWKDIKAEKAIQLYNKSTLKEKNNDTKIEDIIFLEE